MLASGGQRWPLCGLLAAFTKMVWLTPLMVSSLVHLVKHSWRWLAHLVERSLKWLGRLSGPHSCAAGDGLAGTLHDELIGSHENTAAMERSCHSYVCMMKHLAPPIMSPWCARHAFMVCACTLLYTPRQKRAQALINIIK